MQFNKGQILSISELGGPHNSWEYIQAHARVLCSFNSDEEARAFIAAGIYKTTRESMECQFVKWLAKRQYLEFCGPEANQWNVSNTLSHLNGTERASMHC